jgi:hypothetical protein
MHSTVLHPPIARRPRQAAAHGPATRPAPSPPPVDDADPHADSAGLMTLIGVFTVTPLIVVGALIGAVAIGTWWAIVLVMVVHLLTTVVVFGAVAEVMAGRRPTLRLHPQPY